MSKYREIVEACARKNPTEVKEKINEALGEKVYEKLQEQKMRIASFLLRNNQ